MQNIWFEVQSYFAGVQLTIFDLNHVFDLNQVEMWEKLDFIMRFVACILFLRRNFMDSIYIWKLRVEEFDFTTIVSL